MKILFGLLLGALLWCTGVAEAQNVNINCATGSGGTLWQPASASNPCPFTLSSSGTAGPVNVTQWASQALGAMANYGTSPGAVLVPGMNSFVTNANANGQAVMASSSPVVIASNQSALPVNQSPTSSASLGITPVVGGSAVSSLVLKASAGNLYSVYANCTAACWLMVFNATAAPSNGATTAGVASGNMVECVPIGAGLAGGVSYLPGPPAVYTVGMTATISSTACATLTLSTVGFIHGLVQ